MKENENRRGDKSELISQTISLICLNSLSDDFTKTTNKSCTNELAFCSGYFVGLIFLQNEFEMRLAKIELRRDI